MTTGSWLGDALIGMVVGPLLAVPLLAALWLVGWPFVWLDRWLTEREYQAAWRAYRASRDAEDHRRSLPPAA